MNVEETHTAGMSTAGMSEDEIAAWRDEMAVMVTDLSIFGNELGDGDLSGISDVVKQMSNLRNEQINLDDEMLDRDVDRGLEQVSHLLNDCESERRRWDDEERRHNLACRALASRAKEMGQIFKKMEGRK
jgi:hypothetical protein